MTDFRCAAMVSNGWGRFPCSRKGILQSKDGKHYCKQHLPETVAEKRAINQRAWNAKWDLDKKKDQAKAEERIARQKLLEVYRAGGLHGSVYEMVRAWEIIVKDVESYD